MQRRQWLAAALAGIAGAAPVYGQGSYPSRPIKLIVPLAAGGGGDVAARSVGEYIARALQQPVVVENRVGAGTQIGTDAVAKASPDGYTLLLLPGDIAAIDKAFETNVPYDAEKDFVLISGVASIPLVLVANPALKANTLEDVVAKAKAAPGALTFGSLGSSSPHYLFFEWFKHRAGIKVGEVPYKSTSQAVTDLIGGRIDLTMLGEVSAATHQKAGRVVPIATTSERRGKALPQTRTFAESYPGLVMDNWYALAAPAGTPQAVVDALHEATAAALKEESVAQRLGTIGLSPWARSPQQLKNFLPSEIAHYREIIRDSGARHEGR